MSTKLVQVQSLLRLLSVAVVAFIAIGCVDAPRENVSRDDAWIELEYYPGLPLNGPHEHYSKFKVLPNGVCSRTDWTRVEHSITLIPAQMQELKALVADAKQSPGGGAQDAPNIYLTVTSEHGLKTEVVSEYSDLPLLVQSRLRKFFEKS